MKRLSVREQVLNPYEHFRVSTLSLAGLYVMSKDLELRDVCERRNNKLLEKKEAIQYTKSLYR
jgi:hypothetical protein